MTDSKMTTPYSTLVLGETNEEFNIETLKENKNAAIEMIQQARYSIDIFTQNLDEEIFNNEEIEAAVLHLSKLHPNTRTRILAQDSRNAARHGHCMIRLAQSLSSSVFINNPSREYKDEKSAFLIVDRIGLMFRTSAVQKNYNTSVNFKSPQEASRLSDYFTEIWEHSTPDLQTRRLYV